MNDISEFYPIKISPGFITIAFHLGCIGCNFCSVRYGNLRDVLFSGKINRKYPVSPRELYKLLEGMPSFSKARIPIRIGNDTDFKFESRETEKFVSLLPNDYPVIILTRFPVPIRYKHIFNRNNVLLKITITPKSDYLDCPDNYKAILKSLEGINSEVMVTIGPVDASNYDKACSLIKKIPNKRNFSVYIKRLNDEFHPSLKTIPQISSDQEQSLKVLVIENGFRHLSQLTCPLSNRLNFAHKRVSDVPESERKYCTSCSVFDVCYSDDILDEDELRFLLKDLGLQLTVPPVKTGFKSYLITVDNPTAFGDEAYLSEMLKRKIKISNTKDGTNRYQYSSSIEVMKRWQEVSFFPFLALKESFDRFVTQSINSAKERIANDCASDNRLVES